MRFFSKVSNSKQLPSCKKADQTVKKNLSYETFYIDLGGIYYLHAKFQINILKVKDCRNWFRFLSHSLSLSCTISLSFSLSVYIRLSLLILNPIVLSIFQAA